MNKTSYWLINLFFLLPFFEIFASTSSLVKNGKFFRLIPREFIKYWFLTKYELVGYLSCYLNCFDNLFGYVSRQSLFLLECKCKSCFRYFEKIVLFKRKSNIFWKIRKHFLMIITLLLYSFDHIWLIYTYLNKSIEFDRKAIVK